MTPEEYEEQQRQERQRRVDEYERLWREINDLERRIVQAIEEHEQLEAELEFVIAAIVALTASAATMAGEVSQDLTELNKYVSEEEVEARSLFHALKELSEKYFTYKNLSTATKNVTQFTDEYYTRFQFYHELRRIALGCIMAVDTQLISHDAARKQIEKAYLANTDYWLAYAAMAIMLWWSDEPEASERAARRALLMDERKTALLFLFCNLKFGRKEVAAKWYAFYLTTVHANDVGAEYQYLLEAYLSGAFGGDAQLEANIGAKFQDMLSEITLYSIDYNAKVAEAARKFMATKAHVSKFEYFYLPEYCSDCELMKGLLNAAERNAIVADEFNAIYTTEDAFDGVDERLETSIYNLLEAMDDEEEKVYLRIKYNELIVAARGDVAVAEQAYEQRYPADAAVSLGDLMQKWAFTEDDVRILPAVRRFAIGKLAPSMRNGFKQFVDSYRALEQERFEVKLDDWAFSCNENERDIAAANYSEYYDKRQVRNYFKDKFVLIWTAMIAVGVIALVLAIAMLREPAFIVMAALFIVVGAFLLWRQIADVKATLEKRKVKDLEIIEKTLDEMGNWRRAYKEADGAYDALVQATYQFEQ